MPTRDPRLRAIKDEAQKRRNAPLGDKLGTQLTQPFEGFFEELAQRNKEETKREG
jgi:hypothetical protein